MATDTRERAGIGERIRAARLERGMSQEELALSYGRGDQAQISKWENEQKPASDRSIERLAEVLGVSVEWLAYGGEG